MTACYSALPLSLLFALSPTLALSLSYFFHCAHSSAVSLNGPTRSCAPTTGPALSPFLFLLKLPLCRRCACTQLCARIRMYISLAMPARVCVFAYVTFVPVEHVSLLPAQAAQTTGGQPPSQAARQAGRPKRMMEMFSHTHIYIYMCVCIYILVATSHPPVERPFRSTLLRCPPSLLLWLRCCCCSCCCCCCCPRSTQHVKIEIFHCSLQQLQKIEAQWPTLTMCG